MTETEKDVLQEKVRNLQQENENSRQLRDDVQKLQSEISEAQLCFVKEKAKYHSACRQQEASLHHNK